MIDCEQPSNRRLGKHVLNCHVWIDGLSTQHFGMLLTTAAKITVKHLHQVDQALSNRFLHQVGASSSPLGVIAAPAAVLCGIFGATLLGAISYRRSARRITRTLEVACSKLFPFNNQYRRIFWNMFPVSDISRHFLWKPDALPASQRVGRTTLDTVVR